MEIILPKDSYKGVDGSSLSDTRCSQMVLVYEMLESLGDRRISYIDIQTEAEEKSLFGETKAKNAIRTFFPLLKKIGFVNYDDTFSANNCFTDLGRQFVLTCRALEYASNDAQNCIEIIQKLNNVKQNIQKQGLVNLLNNESTKEHNISIALKLLKEFNVIHWNEFLYAIYRINKGISIESVINEIKKDKGNIDSINFVNEKGETLPNTCYSYIRSYLIESGLIENLAPLESKLTHESVEFFNYVSI